jgi:hypothetical protein
VKQISGLRKCYLFSVYKDEITHSACPGMSWDDIIPTFVGLVFFFHSVAVLLLLNNWLFFARFTSFLESLSVSTLTVVLSATVLNP